MAGVVSFLLIDLSALVRFIPVEPGNEIPTITPALKLLSLIQPSILLGLAVLTGIAFAHSVGLSAPVAEAVASASDWVAAIKPQVMPGLIGGLLGTICIVAATVAIKPYFATQTSERISQFTGLMPLPTRFLYGGITEELLLRWGVMTLLVWVIWRVLQKGSTPKASAFVAAILLSAFLFGAGHLPVAFFILPEVTASVVLFVITANSVFGVVAGYLYWKKGLESAMVAHVTCHLLLFIASYVGVYF